MSDRGDRWDLVVAGAGPAGSALAAKAARGGARVLLIEKRHHPGEDRDWVVDVERTTFEKAGVPPPGKDAIWQEPERQIMVSVDGRYRIDMPPSPLLPVRNGVYVRELVSWATGCGAELLTGCEVIGPLLEGGSVRGVIIRTADEERVLRADLTADCTGFAGAVRRGTPSEWGFDGDLPRHDIVLARREVRRIDREEAEEAASRGTLYDGIRADCTGVKGAYSVFFCYLDIEKGFIDILVGGKLMDPGLPTADEWFESILEKWPFIGGKVFGGGAPIPIGRTWDVLVGEGMLLLGDAACQVVPMHGSGTASALIAADMASKTVLRALESGRYDRSSLWDYCHSFQSGRGAVLAYFYAVQRYTDRLTGEDADRMLKKGVISAEDVLEGLIPRPFEIELRPLARKLVKGITEPRLLSGFAAAGLKGERLMRHYRRYPETYDERALARWVRGLPAYARR